jgi:hypothetical protein
MKTNGEAWYNFAKDQYQKAVDSKREIRNRATALFTIFTT